MLNAAQERIKELETQVMELMVAYSGMKAQRDSLSESCRDALSWIDTDTKNCILRSDMIESIHYVEKILKEYLK